MGSVDHIKSLPNHWDPKFSVIIPVLGTMFPQKHCCYHMSPILSGKMVQDFFHQQPLSFLTLPPTIIVWVKNGCMVYLQIYELPFIMFISEQNISTEAWLWKQALTVISETKFSQVTSETCCGIWSWPSKYSSAGHFPCYKILSSICCLMSPGLLWWSMCSYQE